MLLSTQFALRKAAAVARGLPETVGESLRYMQERVGAASTAGPPCLGDSDISCVSLLASAPSVPVVVAGLQAATLLASLRGSDAAPLGVDAARDLLGVVERGLRNPDAAVRSAAVHAVEWVLAIADAEAGGAFVCSLADGAATQGVEAGCAWQVQEAFVMALAAAVRSRGREDALRPVLARCVLGTVLPRCAEAPSKYVRSASMHLCASVVEAWGPGETGHGGGAPTESAASLVSAAVAAVAGGGGGREARFAANLALRAIVRRWPFALLEDPLCSRLLPPLVLGRYYGPDRQRLFCVGTWKLFVGELTADDGGRAAVTKTELPGGGGGGAAAAATKRPSGMLLAGGAAPAAGPPMLPIPAGLAAQRHGLARLHPSPPEFDRSASPSRSSSLSCALLDSHLLTESSAAGATAATTVATRPGPQLLSAPDAATVRDVPQQEAVASGGTSGVGPALVASRMPEIASFYLQQCVDVADPAAREAAAHCIAELTSKVDAAAVRPFATAFLERLHGVCFDEGSGWSARDAAAVAAAKLAKSFPDAIPPACIDDTAAMLADLVGDDHRTVRDHAAAALIELAQAFPRLLSVALSTAQAVVAAPAAAVDADAADRRWCRAAGASCLLRELARINVSATAELLHVLLATLALPDAPLWPSESLCRALPDLCTGLGKPAIKRLLDELLAMLCWAAAACAAPLRQVSDQSASYAIADAAAFLRSFVGRSIFDGHLTPAQAEYLARVTSAGGPGPAELLR